jgi:hypothetical protein
MTRAMLACGSIKKVSCAADRSDCQRIALPAQRNRKRRSKSSARKTWQVREGVIIDDGDADESSEAA